MVWKYIIALLVLNSSSAFGGEDYTLNKNRVALEGELIKILVESNHCLANQSCLSKQSILYEPSKNGFCMNVYAVVDYGVLGKMLQAVAQAAKEIPEGKSICFTANKNTKELDLRRSIWSESPVFLSLEIKGGLHAGR